MSDERTIAIRTLNDKFRKDFGPGQAVITIGVAALGADTVENIVRTLATFDDFSHENDPYGEHDFGALDAAGKRVFFKIDYYSRDLSMHSADPADPRITTRVITLMLAEEY